MISFQFDSGYTYNFIYSQLVQLNSEKHDEIDNFSK